MNKELVIDVGTSEIVIALLEDKQLVELHKEQSNASFSVGDIYLGRVKKIMPGLNAAFVDIGYHKDAFLHYLDLGIQFLMFDKYVNALVKKTPIDFSKIKPEKELEKNGKIEDMLTVGQPVLVQISKEPISTKGPRVTAEISIANRNLVLMPFNNNISISQRISSREEKKRLYRLLASIVPHNFGVIIRTAGEGKKVAVLHNELHTAVQHWTDSVKKIQGANFPCLIATEINRTTAMLRDLLTVAFNDIHINNKVLFDEVKEYIASIAPEKEEIVKLYDNPRTPIFEHFNLVKAVKSGFGKMVSIKNGAYLVIEHTEALHVIDVNSGIRASKESVDQEASALEVNLLSAKEIARQLRLRDMGGIIVVDFIDLHYAENRKLLFDKMTEYMQNDRAKHNILPLSRFGLLQITRHRVRPEMKIQTQEQCPCCGGSGKVGPTLLFDELLENKVAQLVSEAKHKKLTIHLHPYIVAYLTKGWFISKLKKWRVKYLCDIKLVASQDCNYLEYHFYDAKGEELLIQF